MTTSKPDTDMQSLYDYKKFAILYVDDEEKSLKYFARAFVDQFRIFTAANAQDGLKILEIKTKTILCWIIGFQISARSSPPV